jgi:hypothetical protein
MILGAIGYPFTTIPDAALALARGRRLQPVDVIVLAELLRLRRRLRDSCWTTRAVVMAATGRSEPVLRRSLRRLARHGLIDHVKVPVPDPAEPRNRTGWRYMFLFVDRQTASHARELGVGNDPQTAHARELGV